MRRVGVFICWCGSNIAQNVDVEAVARAAATFPGVAHAQHYKYTCSEPGQNEIRKAIAEHNLNRIVVASCSPRMHEPTFRKLLKSAGLNPYLFEMANIREHCSWVHPREEMTTKKAIFLVRAAVAKVMRNESLAPFSIPVTRRALVIGGGVAGIQAALDIADSGFETVLVEKKPTIGGRMSQLDKTFPTLDCSACILSPRMVDVGQHEKIRLLAYSEIESVSGYVGNFKVQVRKKARYVDTKACTACGDCLKVCPVNLSLEHDEGQSTRKAIYRLFPQAVPGAFAIDKKETAPCVRTCPAGVNVQGYIALISQGKFAEAWIQERERNPFPSICGRVCHHPCEAKCNRGKVDQPVAIAALKRFIGDRMLQDSMTDDGMLKEGVFKNGVPASGDGIVPPLPLREMKTEKVAVIGAGPAGLTAAHELAKRGYPVTVFEKLPVPGGMLSVGIPEYRLPKAVVRAEIEFIKALGVEIRTGLGLGKDFTLEDLERDGFAAVFVAVGAHLGQKLGIPGENLEGVWDGVSFLREVNLGNPVKIGRRVAVIGGGNSAVDAARTALRLGADEVEIIYRRSREEMPAIPSEVEEAEREGVRIRFLTEPVEILGSGGKVIGIRCARNELGELDTSGRRRPVRIAGSEFGLVPDTIIAAVGQTPDLTGLVDNIGLGVTTRGLLAANPANLVTGRAGVFAGGDAVTGPATVVEAVASGFRAALAIDRYLNGEKLDKISIPASSRAGELEPAKEFQVPAGIQNQDRQVMSVLPLDARKGTFNEVELGFTETMALEEAKRCLNCAGCSSCMECVKACGVKAVNHDMKDELEEIDVGAIVVATGYDVFDPTLLSEYGYGRYKDVVTSIEFERMCYSGGPTGGELLRRSTGEPLKSVVFVQCAGSRDKHRGKVYCSKTCCMYTAKHAMLLTEKIPDARPYIFYMDVRTPGKGYDEFYRRAAEERGTKYIRGRVAKVYPHGGKLLVKGEDTLAGRPVEVEADMVVLATPMVPQAGAVDLARKLSIAADQDGFYTEAHPKLRPSETNTAGIFLAGACQGPKDIPECVAQASAAAAKVCTILSKEELSVSPMISHVNEEVCSGCMHCEMVCPYRAISEKTVPERILGKTVERKVATVNKGVCQGCGACTVVCRTGAMDLAGFSNEEIMSEVDVLCHEKIPAVV